MKRQKIKLSLLIAITSLLFIPNKAYSSSLKQLNDVNKIENSITLIAQNNDSRDLMNQGWALYNNKQYQEAINYYDQALNLDPNFVEAWFSKAIALYDLERYEEAITSLNQVVNLDQANADAYGLRGAIYILLENKEQGIIDLQKAAELYQSNHQDEEYEYTLKVLQMIQSEPSDNFNESNQNEDKNVADFEENNPYSFFDQGYSFYETQQYDQAINAFNKAIEIKPDFAEAYGLRGGVYYMIGNQETALNDLQMAAQLFTNQNNTEGYQKIQELIQIVQQN